MEHNSQSNFEEENKKYENELKLEKKEKKKKEINFSKFYNWKLRKKNKGKN